MDLKETPIERITPKGIQTTEREYEFDMPTRYANFDDFVAKHIEVTHSEKHYTPEIAAEVRRRFEAHMTPDGASFMKPMRVSFLRRP